MSQFTVVLDACVLYPAPLRSLLMYLAVSDLFRARWTDAIHEEWMRNVRVDYPDITQAQVERIRDLMDAHVRDCLVTEYEDLIEALTLPDPDDRHVLAAAIRAGADVIVTMNLADFPNETLAKYGIEAQHPDQFIMHLLDLAPNVVCSAARKQRESLKRPALTVEQYLESLERQGAGTDRLHAEAVRGLALNAHARVHPLRSRGILVTRSRVPSSLPCPRRSVCR